MCCGFSFFDAFRSFPTRQMDEFLVKTAPSCDSCQARINAHADTMDDEDVIANFVSLFSDYCGQFSTHVEECVSAMEWGVPRALKALVAADRDWVYGFCQAWTAC